MTQYVCLMDNPTQWLTYDCLDEGSIQWNNEYCIIELYASEAEHRQPTWATTTRPVLCKLNNWQGWRIMVVFILCCFVRLLIKSCTLSQWTSLSGVFLLHILNCTLFLFRQKSAWQCAIYYVFVYCIIGKYDILYIYPNVDISPSSTKM